VTEDVHARGVESGRDRLTFVSLETATVELELDERSLLELDDRVVLDSH
jgi:hypothetical protein